MKCGPHPCRRDGARSGLPAGTTTRTSRVRPEAGAVIRDGDCLFGYPKMIVGDKSLTLLHRFFIGFEMALKHSKAEYNTYSFFTDFDDFVRYRYRKYPSLNWCSKILEEVDNDEEKAVDLFFALLEEFKLEKEDLEKY